LRSFCTSFFSFSACFFLSSLAFFCAVAACSRNRETSA
jgi:hypothetical protein